jgi:hypothetical protein
MACMACVAIQNLTFERLFHVTIVTASETYFVIFRDSDSGRLSSLIEKLSVISMPLTIVANGSFDLAF